MSNINEDIGYLGNQLKKGVLVGAGVTLFASGILMGLKTASFIMDVSSKIGEDGVKTLKKSMKTILEEYSGNDDKENDDEYIGEVQRYDDEYR